MYNEEIDRLKPIKIDPEGYYGISYLIHGYGFDAHSLNHAIREKQLKSIFKGGITLIRGDWLVDWLQS